MKDKVVIDFQVCDLGMEHSDYFQGFGVSHTDYTDCAVGIGDNPKEAYEDALDQLATSGWDVSLISENVPDEPSVSGEDEAEREAEFSAALATWIEEQEADGKVNVSVATEADHEAGNVFDPDDFEMENDNDNENTRHYYVGIRVREFDSERDDSMLACVAFAVQAISKLAIRIHCTVAKLQWGVTNKNMPRIRGRQRINLRRKLARHRRQRDELEAFIKANHESHLDVSGNLLR